MLEKGVHDNRLLQRHGSDLMFGVNKNLMLHAGLSVSDMHERKMIFESVRVYGKYRFLSIDDVHKHFRMAAFAGASISRNHLDHNEVNLMGDHTGVQAGLIATQLWNKFALSATGSWNEILDEERWQKVYPNNYSFNAFNYSLSAGYLVLPINYTNYDQTNVNVYAELLGAKNGGEHRDSFYVDLAPSLQFIFKSTSKLNLGYRFQLDGNIYRLAENSFMISYEHLFLNALRKPKKKELIP